jgi:galactofuranosylgalactofuranosylrhamnosyl-N-acetylglucosaminyl-diphospho-decaprenol beta-1,5/1,6-galactofuranosyltransferase
MSRTQEMTLHEGAIDAAAPAPGMVAGRWLFAGPAETVNDDLYAVSQRGAVSRSRTTMTLGPGTQVSGNTYFGRFPATYWQRWTAVRQIRLELTVTGSGRLAVAASDLGGFAKVVTARTVRDADRQQIVLVAPLTRFADGGALWLDLETAEGQRLTVADARWTVDAPARSRVTTVGFATIDRPEFCLGVLRALAADRFALDRVDGVLVVDHGAEPVAALEEYQRIAAELGPKLRHIVEPNLGSAGGCNRVLYESHEHSDDVLLLDDDILLEPEIIVRLTAFGAHRVRPMIIGGQMLNYYHPNVLLADAQRVDTARIQPGVPVPHARPDVDLRAAGSAQERRLDAGYNAWWACLIPIEVVDRIGYILPMFSQADDAEFCYRARAHGIPTITLPGAGLWHTDFTLKDLDDFKTYFIRRNYLIMSALHGEFRPGPLVRQLSREVGQCLLGMRYGLAATVLAAVEHFLDGPGDLRDGGVRRLEEVKRFRAAYPDTTRHPAGAVPGVEPGDLAIAACGPPPKHPLACALGRALGQLRGRQRSALGEIAHDEARWWHVSRFTAAVVTDASQEGVRLRRHDRDRMIGLAWRTARTMLRLRLEGRRAQRRYRAALPDLSARENWTRLFELD